MPNSLTLTVNQQDRTASCDPGTSLLSLLRDLGYKGVHRVCESGDCGCCTVWLEDKPIHSCITPAWRADSHQITTIEGLGSEGLAPMQEAFLAAQGFQCGYCTPGVIMTATKLDYESETELRGELEGNLCRCTGYQSIVDSILLCESKAASSPTQQKQLEQTEGQVGKNIPKQDGTDIVTGKPIYTDDWVPVGLLHLKVLRSPHPHARITHIDTQKAAALDGVQAIFTHADVPRRPYSTAGHGEGAPDPMDHYLLDRKVRFIGDRVAAVVADTEAIATRACELIEVEYDILPHVIDPAAAMTGEVLIHDEVESTQIKDASRNIAGEVFLEKGNVEAGFAEAEVVVEKTYRVPAVQHVHLEPHTSTSWFDEDGTLVVRSSTQVPFHCQRILSELFDIPPEKLRVYKANIGGGFGNKQEILTEDLCVLATLHLKRPVQWRLTRKEEFTATNSRHGMTIRLKTGVNRDGTILAQEMEAISNTGAYGNHGQTVVFLTGCFPLGLYRCSHQRFRGIAVYTNTMPGGAFRGYGATQGTFAVESQLDEIANQLNLDPIVLRHKNFITAEDEILIGREKHFHIIGSYALADCVEKVTQAFSQSEPKTEEAPYLRRGVGFAATMQASGLAKIHKASVCLSLQPNGSYRLKTGSVDVGTGSDTTLRQVAAHVLNTTVDQIELIAADTQQTPFDAGSYASATMFISGQAVNLAAKKLRSHLLELAATDLDCDQLKADQLALTANAVCSSSAQISLPELAAMAQKAGQFLEVELDYSSDTASLTFAFMGVEVEVDTQTGRVRVLRCAEAIDVGKAINPRICHGQATGGMVMGLGYALSEELRMDERGQILNPTLRTYRIPAAKDVPLMDVFLVEKADPYGPFGAKGIGEIGTNCTAPAIANAIANATGARVRQLPMTPERVWRALQQHDKED
ncbi:molybdopterin-dependent oxidoreductase [Oscillatoria sp. CS-180]|uniref:molybdopterin-dependent oxidoreductase n=1 Tax=Oscillatoria sp. CS-180 TaxID=3021720 RepID=UPI00232E76EC|nr:molybdopterin cofactor-binding domain-containing protein [Oscillatoria sp. CS-180]MDB9525821.1 molybdopterin-dependent oxidoreductase [Oscillatoria sp. CS-180]